MFGECHFLSPLRQSHVRLLWGIGLVEQNIHSKCHLPDRALQFSTVFSTCGNLDLE